jgi:hypothetical protein
MAGEVHPQVFAEWRKQEKLEREEAIAAIAAKIAASCCRKTPNEKDLDEATVKYWNRVAEERSNLARSAAEKALASAKREAESLRQQLEVERRSWVPRPIRNLYAVFL